MENRCKINYFSEDSPKGSLFLEIYNGFNFDDTDGFIQDKINDKMLCVLEDNHRLQEITRVSTVSDFNNAAVEGRSTDIINVSEVLQARRIAAIADEIEANESIRMVLIAGPSSSGKTTFCKRLSIQLMAVGLHPVPLSLDDYFVNRVDTPLGDDGKYDFESLYAIDLDLFNNQLAALLRGEKIELPHYNFETGCREFNGTKMQLRDEKSILVIEGIHALNPKLTHLIPKDNKYHIFVSVLTSLMLDDNAYIPTTDNRLLRRILRDYQFRGFSAKNTIAMWPNVRKGEERWIFSFLDRADTMFNSSFLYELAILKDKLVPILKEVEKGCLEYEIAQNLLGYLKHFNAIPDKAIPPTSLLREFVGGSSYHY